MTDAFVRARMRTPIGRYAWALSSVRTDDLGAVPIPAPMERHPAIDRAALDEVRHGAGRAGGDSRDVARLSALPERV